MSSPDYPTDAWLDARLREVPVPQGLLDRLVRVAAPDDHELDARLRDVPLPEGLLRRLRRTISGRTRRLRMARWATAASIMLAVGTWYFAFVLSMVVSTVAARPGGEGPFDPMIEAEPIDRAARVEIELPALPPGSDPELEAELARVRDVASPDLPLAELESPSARPVGFLLYPLAPLSGMDLTSDSTYPDWKGALGAPRGLLDQADIDMVPLPAPRGIEPPIVPGFNLRWLREFGIHPFVMPALHQELHTSRVPLDIDRSSYVLARKYLGEGMLPPRDAVRTEEFLAAVDYRYPRPKRGEDIGLFSAGGPSPFRFGDQRLLQVGVQARDVTSSDRPGTRLTLAVDISASMRWGGRLEMVVRAIEQLERRLGHRDRLSMVVFCDRADVLCEDLARDELDELVEVLRGMTASGSTNIHDGLRRAYALAARYAGSDRLLSRVVLLSDGLAELDPSAVGRVEALLEEAAGRGIVLHAVDLGQERAGEQPDGQLARFAAAGGGTVHRATKADEVRWALMEAVTGRSQLVAADVQLRVVFNPGTVYRYRLLGHESKAIIGLGPPQLEADFRSGQAATALYELELLSGGGDDLAVAEVSWVDAETGARTSVQRKVRRKDFAPSVDKMPLPLQAAAAAAQSAELLRGSPFAQPPFSAGGIERLTEYAERIDSRLLLRPSFRELIDLMKKAATARPYRAGGRR